jgi:hypothetical protein
LELEVKMQQAIKNNTEALGSQTTDVVDEQNTNVNNREGGLDEEEQVNYDLFIRSQK